MAHPARVGRAGLGGRGDRVSGVRVVKGFGAERVQADAAPRTRPTTSTTRRWPRPGCGPATCRRMELLPNIGLILVLGYGGHQVLDGTPQLGDARRVQRLHRAADLAAADARADHRPGPAGRGVGPAGARGARRPIRRSSTARDAELPPPGRRSPRLGEVRFEQVVVRLRRRAGRAGARPALDLHDRSRASRWRWSAPPAAASRPSPGCCPASTTSTAARSCSTASTCATSSCIDLRRAVGLVFEETFLFSDTIADNIAFADPDADDDDDRAGRPAGRRRRVHQRRCPTATPPRSASGASRCRAASASASPSPGPSSPTRGC